MNLLSLNNHFEFVNSLKFFRLFSSGTRLFAIRYQDDELYSSSDGGTLWTSFDHQGSTQYWKDIIAIDSLTAVAIGDTIMMTRDGGISWYGLPAPGEQDGVFRFYAQHWWSSERGIICGKNLVTNFFYLFSTTDSGTTWTLCWQSLKTTYTNADLFFYHERGWLGLLTGSGCDSLWRSEDSGMTWAMIYAPAQDNLRPNRFSFTDSLSGWATGKTRSPVQPALMATRDGGVSWSLLDTTAFALNAFATLPDGSLIGAGDWGMMASHSSNATQLLTPNAEDFSFTGLSATPECVVLSNATTGIYLSYTLTDHNCCYHPTPFTPCNLAFPSTGRILGIGSAGKRIYLSEDNGENWNYFNNPFSVTWKGFVFADSATGWLIGDSLLYTHDGGYSWQDRSDILSGNYMLLGGMIRNDTFYTWGKDETTGNGVIWRYQENDSAAALEFSATSPILAATVADDGTLYAAAGKFLVSLIPGFTRVDTIFRTSDNSDIQAVASTRSGDICLATENGFVCRCSSSQDQMVWSEQAPSAVTSLVELNECLWICGEGGLLARHDFSVSAISVTYALSETLLAGLYPNPNHGRFTLHTSRGAQSPVHYKIFDLLGRVCSHGVCYSARTSVNVQELPSGRYILKILDGSPKSSLSFTVVR